MLSIEEIVLLIEKLEKLRGTDFDRLIDDNLKILKDLQKVVDTNNAKLSGSREKTVGWFTRDLANKRNKQRNLLLERTIQLKIYQFARANIYSSLEIGPGNGDFSMDFRKFMRVLDRAQAIQERRNSQLDKQKQKAGRFKTK